VATGSDGRSLHPWYGTVGIIADKMIRLKPGAGMA
jgi:hypothetical protein